MVLHQFDYIFAIGMLFAFLDAWNIGANDVSNSWASAVASRAMTYPQAMLVAGVMEFLGAVLAGSRVTSTIRNNIIDVSLFDDAPASLMLLMACALVGSSLWLTIATRLGAPVSTTHSIVGGIIGAGIAAHGGSAVHWGWDGFAKIVASWFVSPLVAGGFAIIIFYFTKYGVLERRAALRNGLTVMPLYVFITIAVLTMSVVWKGAPNLKLDELSGTTVAVAIVVTGLVVAVLYCIFMLPFLHRKLVLEDWTLRWWEAIYGPFLLRRSKNIPPMPEGHQLVIDYYDKSGKKKKKANSEQASPVFKPEIKVEMISPSIQSIDDQESRQESGAGVFSSLPSPRLNPNEEPVSRIYSSPPQQEDDDEKLPGFRDGKPYTITKHTWPELKKPKNWHRLFVCALLNGVRQDVLGSQVRGDSGFSFLGKSVQSVHTSATKYDLKVEYIYSFLQCITAATASWSHGSNDISNAVGPLATIYQVWQHNSVGGESIDTPIWVLVYASVALVIGLWTYGYNLMRNLGNKLILQSPSRGFSIELGAALTTIFAGRLGLPVSTTQCLIGATTFVGLANNNWRAVNWNIVLFSYIGWFLTVPCAGLISGIIMGIIINAPHLGQAY